MDNLLRRKIDSYLVDWKNDSDRKPLIIKGARQIGKTRSVEYFAYQNYKSVVQINFVEQPKYKSIFDDGFEVDAILKNISFLNPELRFIPRDTLFFFDELQACPNCATSLKFFKLPGATSEAKINCLPLISKKFAIISKKVSLALSPLVRL